MESKFNKRINIYNLEVKGGYYIIPHLTLFKNLRSIIQNDGEKEGIQTIELMLGGLNGGVP